MDIVVFLGFSRIRIMAGGGFRRLPPILRLGDGHDGLGAHGVFCTFGHDPFLGFDDPRDRLADPEDSDVERERQG
ncbi:MAG TPA: hypothetical protein VLR91_02840, partial [Thermodesulfobacteriota bacterium]|nr:hypothetical protein [Thermodesulfobacteriota bacterium]